VVLLAALLGGLCERDDGMPILACVMSELVPAQLTAAPPAIEGVLEQVPAPSHGIESLDQLHLSSFLG
jgi:hypothetical protein